MFFVFSPGNTSGSRVPRVVTTIGATKQHASQPKFQERRDHAALLNGELRQTFPDSSHPLRLEVFKCNLYHVFQCIKKNLEKFCVQNGMFNDVTFELDDGHMKAHRAMLVARCDVMRAMLNGDFKEAHSNIVSI